MCLCVYACMWEFMYVYAGPSNANTLPASCKQIGQLWGVWAGTLKWTNKGLEKFKTVSVLTFYPSKHWMSPWFWEKIFLTGWSRLWPWEQRWLPNMARDENSSVGCHKFNFDLCPINTWLEKLGRNKDQSLAATDFLLWTSAWFSWGCLLKSVSLEFEDKNDLEPQRDAVLRQVSGNPLSMKKILKKK